MIHFYTATLGCKINQYETRSIAEAWIGPGGSGDCREVDDPAQADVILVNSCAVTANAVSDLRKTVRKLHRTSPGAEIVVTGCAAQVLAEEVADLPGVVRVVSQDRKAELLAGPRVEPRDIQPTGFAPFSIQGYDRARAVVKVQDGCSHHCTYCIVPITRGPSVSRSPEEVVAEAARLMDNGFRELILSGINLRHWGRGLAGKPEFWDLIARLEAELGPRWAGRARLRISSVEPGQLDAKGLDTLAGSTMICPQLHLSLQSGDPDVLRRMGRGHYDPETAITFMDELSKSWPVIGLGADLLVGFPGETDAEFETTLDFCRRLPLTYAHVFPYSERPGTRAADMNDQVDPGLRKSRAARLRGVIQAKKRAFTARVAGLDTVDVLRQDAEGNGVSQYYVPCRLTGPLGNARSLVRARPLHVEGSVVLAEPLEVL